MDIENIVSKCDHTLLKQESTFDQIKEICDDAIKYGTASVCIPPCYVFDAANYISSKGSNLSVCTVIGFPNGNSTTESKVFEAKQAIENGASEIDMVINIGQLRASNYKYVQDEIIILKKACGQHILKVIIETCLLTEEEKIKMCEIVTDSGADYIKTSTGFSTSGANIEDIKLFAQHVGKNVKIKAAGGISTLQDAQEFIDCGASRLGTSRIIKLVKQTERN